MIVCCMNNSMFVEVWIVLSRATLLVKEGGDSFVGSGAFAWQFHGCDKVVILSGGR